MSYKVEQIEGIGPAYAAKLEAALILTTEELLDRCATRPDASAPPKRPASRRNCC